MILTIITNEYPYGKQESFLEDELRVLEKYFTEIHIYTFAASKGKMRFIPNNASVKLLNENNQFIKILSWVFLALPKNISEMLFVKKQFDYKVKQSIPILARYYVYSSYVIPQALKYEDVDNTIFYSYWLAHQAYGLSVYKKRNKEAICISRAHGFDNYIVRGLSYFRREIVTSFNGIYPISNAGLLELKNKVVPLSANHCVLREMHLGVSVPERNEDTKLVEKRLIICSCSFISQIKRLDIIIEMLSKIDDFEIHWVHFGGGQMEQEIHELATVMLETKKNVSYEFKGQTDHDHILDYYLKNSIDIFINASDHEGIPVSIMEAMAYSIPCIARDVGGNREIVKNGYNGRLLSSNANADDFIEAIRSFYFLSMQEKRDMKRNAYTCIEQDFNKEIVYDAFAREIINLFENS